jgi:hypothetical protein
MTGKWIKPRPHVPTYSNSKWKLLHAYLPDMKNLRRMNDEELKSFLEAFDAICLVCLQNGISGAQLAGAVLARVQHLYLADDQADLAGLERLLEMPLKRLRSRPSWDIE